MPDDRPSRSFVAEMRELYALMPQKRRRQFAWLLVLMLLGAFAELATIGSVVPFLTLLTMSGTHAGTGFAASVLQRVNASTGLDPLLAATLLFVGFLVLAGVLRLALSWSSQSFVVRLGHDLAVELQRRILLQPYSYHIAQNTSVLITALDKVQLLVDSVLLQLMYAATALVVSLFIIAALMAVDPVTALIATAFFAVLYLCISAVTRRRLQHNSAVFAAAYEERLAVLQESLGGIRDVIIENAQPLYGGAFARVDQRLSRALLTTHFIGAAPRIVIETLGMAVLAVLAYAIGERSGSMGSALPALGALVLGAQRLLPLVQQIYHSWSSISAHRSTATQVLDFLRLPVQAVPSEEAPSPLPLRDRITLDEVTFTYPSRRNPAVAEISLEIAAGERLGIVGRTGSGKSTLADLVMGLLEAQSGSVRVDGTPLTEEVRSRWHRSIAHVPQSIFLADASIAQNIAFGAAPDEVDMARVAEAAEAAQLSSLVATLAGGYATRVGERGVRLSGGQRQRLGIARAIYKGAPILVLDEATSALDEETEATVMNALDRLASKGRTLLVIAHRKSTLSHCDRVVRLADGRIEATGTYDEMFAKGGPSRPRSPSPRGK